MWFQYISTGSSRINKWESEIMTDSFDLCEYSDIAQQPTKYLHIKVLSPSISPVGNLPQNGDTWVRNQINNKNNLRKASSSELSIWRAVSEIPQKKYWTTCSRYFCDILLVLLGRVSIKNDVISVKLYSSQRPWFFLCYTINYLRTNKCGFFVIEKLKFWLHPNCLLWNMRLLIL